MSVNLHLLDGTHKLELPVSNTTLKFCGGVPEINAHDFIDIHFLRNYSKRALPIVIGP